MCHFKMLTLTSFHVALLSVIFVQTQGDDNNIALRIYGGLTAAPRMFPSIGYIVASNGVNMCGATLISQEWAVTAAHCFNRFNPEQPVPVRVVFGDIDVSLVNKSHQESCFDVIIHEDYSYYSLSNDIALLHLKTPVNITDHVKPVNLSTTFADTKTFRKCFVAGWGATDYFVYPDVLQFTEVEIQEAALCESVFDSETMSQSESMLSASSSEYENPYNEDFMICAGNEESDACDGDSGGPLYCVDHFSPHHELVGIVSFGQPNCTPGLKGVYTRVSAYTNWIEQTSDGESTTYPLTLLLFIIYLGTLLSQI